MLRQLIVNNIALIEHVEISFGEGLHVITGETGAGKSIVVDAVCLLLGGRTDRELIRAGCEKAYVEGTFDLADSHAVLSWLETHDYDTEEYLVISREINISGRSVCRIQGISVPVAQLKELASMLMDIHGQHEHQSLLNDALHLYYLDSFGDKNHDALLLDTKEKYVLYHDAYLKYSKLKKSILDKEEKIALLREQETELADAHLSEGEENVLLQENERLKNHEKIEHAFEIARNALISDEKSTATGQIRTAMPALSSIENMGPDFSELSKRTESLYYDAEDIGILIQKKLDNLDYDAEACAHVEERLDLIRKLSRKYGPTTKDMLHKLQEIREELNISENLEDHLNAAKEYARRSYKDYMEAASKLSLSRKSLAEALSKKVENQLSDLNMPGIKFVVELNRESTSPSPNGQEKARFLIAPNLGEDLKPLSKIASGGELSRIMLAIKSISAEKSDIPSMVFDEIDSGISGRTAQVVAQKLWDIARYRQVICVTHLQQIAAMATRHYLIKKNIGVDRTNTYVTELNGEERISEINRMLSGVTENSDSGRIHARTMLEEAESYRCGKQ